MTDVYDAAKRSSVMRQVKGRDTISGGVLGADQKITRQEALKLETINNAYLHHEEGEKGSLEVGKLADLIMVDRDPLTCPADDIMGTKVLLTVLGGKVVFERK